MIRKVAAGIYEWLPLGLRVIKKVESIIREEMNNIGGQEVSFPLLLPKELWEETGRWYVYGKELFRLKDRKESDFCLGPTHEEVVTDLVRSEVRSYRELPLMIYQFGTKFRDEIRPRFGVMRAREFLMKDAYSFHSTEEDAERYYNIVCEAYSKIFTRCGLRFVRVDAETGAIGGKFSHEFMVLAATGEEVIATCPVCGYAANVEKLECVEEDISSTEEMKELEEVYTPNLRTVEEVANFLNASREKFIKSLIYVVDNKEPILVLIGGAYEVNESKLKNVLGCSQIELASEEVIEKVSGAPVGFAGPVGLKMRVKIVADFSAKNIVNAISGANKKDYHLKNINYCRDWHADVVCDIRKVKEGDVCVCPQCYKIGKNRAARLKFYRGIEVGHTFKLGTKYSKSMEATFVDSDGQRKYYIMGCYGIGVSRIVAAVIEQSHDENGIIWPLSIAPFQVIVLPIDFNSEKQREFSLGIYNELLNSGIEVLLDDRDERPGVKFKDADLIGIPIRITVSEKHISNNTVGIKLRWEKEEKAINRADMLSCLKEMYALYSKYS
jgi:prolyl-tRNA synthetase